MKPFHDVHTRSSGSSPRSGVSTWTCAAAPSGGVPFRVDERPVAGRTDLCELAVNGEFDLAGVETWDAHTVQWLERHRCDIVLDLAGLVFIDASGMGALVRLADRLRISGHRLELRHPAPHVRRAFVAARLDHLLLG